jgi:mediator of RNA polymerase II transcription subunit 13
LSNDPDAHLVDVGDETFGLILGHKTNISGSLADFRPSLSSGYLMKTNVGSPTPLDDEEDRALKGPILVGVNLVWIGSSPRNNGGNAQSPQTQQSPQQSLPSSSPTEQGTGNMPSQAGPSTPTGGASTSSNNIPKATADGILKEYLTSYRNLGVLARARGLRGTKRGALPWHVVVALRGVEGLEIVYGRLGG